jgi:hypothetical protein
MWSFDQPFPHCHLYSTGPCGPWSTVTSLARVVLWSAVSSLPPLQHWSMWSFDLPFSRCHLYSTGPCGPLVCHFLSSAGPCGPLVFLSSAVIATTLLMHLSTLFHQTISTGLFSPRHINGLHAHSTSS